MNMAEATIAAAQGVSLCQRSVSIAVVQAWQITGSRLWGMVTENESQGGGTGWSGQVGQQMEPHRHNRSGGGQGPHGHNRSGSRQGPHGHNGSGHIDNG